MNSQSPKTYSSLCLVKIRLHSVEILFNPILFCSSVDSIVRFPESNKRPAKSGCSPKIFSFSITLIN